MQLEESVYKYIIIEEENGKTFDTQETLELFYNFDI